MTCQPESKEIAHKLHQWGCLEGTKLCLTLLYKFDFLQTFSRSRNKFKWTDIAQKVVISCKGSFMARNGIEAKWIMEFLRFSGMNRLIEYLTRLELNIEILSTNKVNSVEVNL